MMYQKIQISQLIYIRNCKYLSIDVLETTNISVDSEWEDKNHDDHDFNVGGDVFDDDEGVDRMKKPN